MNTQPPAVKIGAGYSSAYYEGSKGMWGAGAIWGASSDAVDSMSGASAIWSSKALWGASDTSTSECVVTN